MCTACPQGAVSVAASARLGKVIDLAWVPLPGPVGAGSVVVVAGEDGSLALVDATQTLEARSLKRRMAAFTNLVGGRWPFPQARPLSAPAIVHRSCGVQAELPNSELQHEHAGLCWLCQVP